MNSVSRTHGSEFVLDHWVTFAFFLGSLNLEVFVRAWEVSWQRLQSSFHPWKVIINLISNLIALLMKLIRSIKTVFQMWHQNYILAAASLSAALHDKKSESYYLSRTFANLLQCSVVS